MGSTSKGRGEKGGEEKGEDGRGGKGMREEGKEKGERRGMEREERGEENGKGLAPFVKSYIRHCMLTTELTSEWAHF